MSNNNRPIMAGDRRRITGGWLWSQSIVAACCYCLLLAGASAQQDPMYTMYMWNTLSVNPAYAGSRDRFSATGLARQQWVGLDGAPNTQTFTAHAPLPVESLGAGFSMVHDEVGPVNSTAIFGHVAYRIRATENARLAFGVNAGVHLYTAHLTGLANVDASDPLFGQDLAAKAAPNFGSGLYYWSGKGYLGVSVPELLEHDLFVSNAADNAVHAGRQRRHYFLIGGYVFGLGKDVELCPSFLVKAVEGAPISLDLSAMFVMRDKIWFGAAYRSGDAISAKAAYQISERFKVGYAYDMGISRLRSYHNGSHELMVSYDLPVWKEKGQTLEVRYF